MEKVKNGSKSKKYFAYKAVGHNRRSEWSNYASSDQSACKKSGPPLTRFCVCLKKAQGGAQLFSGGHNIVKNQVSRLEIFWVS